MKAAGHRSRVVAKRPGTAASPAAALALPLDDAPPASPDLQAAAVPAVATMAPTRARRGLASVASAAAGALAAVGLLAVAIPGLARLPVPAEAALPDAAQSVAMQTLAARVDRLEAQLAAAAELAARRDLGAEAIAGRIAAIAEQVARMSAEPEPPTERFMAAALLLQSSITTPRPWLREYRAMVDLAPPGVLSRPAAEVLLSHAARGVPSEAELRERFAVLMPQLLARAPRGGTPVDNTVAAIRGGLASVGLTAPPPPTDQEQAIAGVAQQLRRGNLAAAVSDAASLDAGMQPLLSGWLAQARARLAVEQAVQETLLRLLSPAARPS